MKCRICNTTFTNEPGVKLTLEHHYNTDHTLPEIAFHLAFDGPV